MKAANQLPALLLRSPLHRLLSDRLMLLTFTGRKTGQRYTTPVVVVRHGDELLLTTDSRWWRNLRGEGAPVSLRAGRRTVRGTARADDDPAATRRVLEEILGEHPRYATWVRLRTLPDGTPDVDGALRSGRVGVRVRVT